jgi:hypothetical protein
LKGVLSTIYQTNLKFIKLEHLNYWWVHQMGCINFTSVILNQTLCCTLNEVFLLVSFQCTRNSNNCPEYASNSLVFNFSYQLLIKGCNRQQTLLKILITKTQHISQRNKYLAFNTRSVLLSLSCYNNEYYQVHSTLTYYS